MMRFDCDHFNAALRRPRVASTDYDLNPDVRPNNRALKPAAVLVAVSLAGPRPAVILTKRASHLKYHPGQIAFPGGKLDLDDASATAAALREAWEEIALPPAVVEVCGELAPHETITAYQITPILGLVRDVFEPIPAPDEVAEVFTVPMDYLMDLTQYRIESRIWGGQRRRFFVVPYGPYYIWGATARILHGLALRMQP